MIINSNGKYTYISQLIEPVCKANELKLIRSTEGRKNGLVEVTVRAQTKEGQNLDFSICLTEIQAAHPMGLGAEEVQNLLDQSILDWKLKESAK